MRCGVRLTAAGEVRHAWMLVSDDGVEIPIDDSDTIMEFKVPHGEDLEPLEERDANREAAVQMQDTFTIVAVDRVAVEAFAESMRSTRPVRFSLPKQAGPAMRRAPGMELVYRLRDRAFAVRQIPQLRPRRVVRTP